MTPRVVAARFVERAFIRLADDLLDLDEHDPATYRRLEAAVRKRLKLPSVNLDRLHRAVIAAVPEPHRDALRGALEKYVTAELDAHIVGQHAAYALGVAVGRSLAPSVAERIGEGACALRGAGGAR